MRFEGKSVVVTGASSGMGRQIAYDFAKEGATVVAVAPSASRSLRARSSPTACPARSSPMWATSAAARSTRA